MDPCAFVRLTVDQLLLKLPSVPRPTTGAAGVHPSTSPCFCTLHLQDYHHPSSSGSLSRTTAQLPLASSESPAANGGEPVVISLDAAAVQRLSSSARHAELVVSVHAGQKGGGTTACGMGAGRALGRVRVPVDVVRAAAGETIVARDGWVDVGKPTASAAAARIHMVVRAEPDPRYVFQFGGEPECGPVVYQVPGGAAAGGQQRQPVFTCRFSAGRRATRTRSLTSESSMTRSTSRKLQAWLSTLHGGDRDAQARREQRKGWTVTIHDLSGSPVAMASMVTPFVPSPAGSGRVSRANPGSWLILQPTGAGPSSCWKPWARLEAWRERGPGVDALGYRLELVFDSGPTECAVPIAESSISTKRGGQFVIDPATFPAGGAGAAAWPFSGGFVMGSTVEGEGRASRPTVQVGVQHATCMGDVALFVALAAAVDLCMDACKLFSQRLRKELCHDQED
uniref:DUF1005 domain-containing protein n=1 Tax=Leersia perrieri TaxID=77586 RepID=A0A0D9V5G0_9ORYZ